MEDAAVKQEEWCIPEKRADQLSELNCEQYLSYINVVNNKNNPFLELRQCEATRRRMQNQKSERKEKENKGEN